MDGRNTPKNPRKGMQTMKPNLKFAIPTLCAAGFVSLQATAAPTFTKDVAPILYENCVACHRAGDIAPMSLITYNEVRPWAKAIEKNVREGVMPPWHADPGYGPFSNERSLSKDQIDTIVEWVQAGTPQGNPKDLPEAPEFEDGGWRLGEPDLVLTLDRVDVPAAGPDMFKDLVVDPGLEEDTWVTGIEFKPGSRKVVHHVILWQGDKENPGPGQSSDGWISAWAAGADPTVMPKGTGRLLKKDSVIIADIHYHPADTDESDVTQVGLHFAKDEDIEKQLVNLWVMNIDFAIPPGDDNYEARSTHVFGQDSHILGLSPHMHYRGKDFSYTATFPDGTQKELLKVSKYDFNWQTNYILEEPIPAPKGTRIDCVAHWDNSANNLANPDPNKTVTFGPESYDEMMIGFVDYIVDEGVFPSEESSPMLGKLVELNAAHPGDVYKLTNPQGPDGEPQINAIYIPREGGEGGWYVTIGAIVAKARLFNIAWDGDSFTAKMAIPGQGVNDLSGTYDAAAKQMNLKMVDPSGEAGEMAAELVE